MIFSGGGREHSVQPTDHDLASHGLLRTRESGEVQLPPEKLRSIVLELKRNLHEYYQRRGMSPKLDERRLLNTVDDPDEGWTFLN